MELIHRVWARLKEPSLVGRTSLSVLAAFILVFAVLLGYQYKLAREGLDNGVPGLKRYGDAILLSLDALDDAGARDALAVTASWVNIRRKETGRNPLPISYELRNAAGEAVFMSPALLAHSAAAAAPGMSLADIGGQQHRVYEARSPRWTLRVAEPWRSDSSILAYNARFLLPYLLMALPLVVVPLWLSARNGLKPLQQLADRIRGREADDLQPVGLVVRHRELKPLVGALDSLLQRLRERIARERSFVQDAAHELRTPLAVVTAHAHVLARSDNPAERGQAHANLNLAIVRASHLARQLLVLASMDDTEQPALRHIDVAQAVRQLLAQAEPAALARHIELSLDAPDVLWGRVNEPALESIVFNLVDNAVRYGREGGNVVVVLSADEERMMLQVRDDGPGIEPAGRERVFERFYRGAGHDAPGSGLGLAIVRQAAARMKGHVTLTDGIAGTGAGFLVSIPVAGFAPG